MTEPVPADLRDPLGGRASMVTSGFDPLEEDAEQERRRRGPVGSAVCGTRSLPEALRSARRRSQATCTPNRPVALARASATSPPRLSSYLVMAVSRDIGGEGNSLRRLLWSGVLGSDGLDGHTRRDA